MDVFFKPMYSTEEKTEKGICQKTNITFEYNGNQCCIPAVYLFNEGIVFDIFEKIDSAKAESFVLKAIGYEKNPPAEAQLRVIELNNPFNDFYLEALSANEKASKHYIGNTVYIYSSHLQKKINAAGVMKDVQKKLIDDWKNEYSFFKGNESYSVHRYMYQIENLNCKPIKKLKITTKERREAFTINRQINLSFGIQDKNTKIDFIHPLTQDNASIFINEVISEDTSRFQFNNTQIPPYAIFVKFETTNNVFGDDHIIFELLNKDEDMKKIACAFGAIISNANENRLGLNGYPVRFENVGSLTYLPNKAEISVVGIDVKMSDEIEYEWDLHIHGILG